MGGLESHPGEGSLSQNLLGKGSRKMLRQSLLVKASGKPGS